VTITGLRASGLRTAASAVLLLMAGACIHESPPGQLSPVKADLPQAARDNTVLGTEYMRQGLMDRAIEKLKRAISDDPSYAPAHATLAWAYSLRGNNAEADQEFKRALSANSDDSTTHFYLGSYQCQNRNFEDGQRNLLSAAHDLNFEGAMQAWTSAGQCAAGSKNPAQAVVDLNSALQIDPNFPPALGRMAAMQFTLGDFAQALVYLHRYERVGPPSPDLLDVGMRSERSLGHFDAAREYELKLRQKFPDSEEAAKLQARPSAQ